MLMNKDIESVLVDEKQLDEITTRLAAEIDRDYQDTGRPLVMVCILKGSVMFYTDLIKKIRRPVEMEFMARAPLAPVVSICTWISNATTMNVLTSSSWRISLTAAGR